MRIARAVPDRLPAALALAFSTGCRTCRAVARRPPAVRTAVAVRSSHGPFCCHRGVYDRCLHAGGGESRRRPLLLELGRDRTPGYPDPAGTRLARRVGGARTWLCRRPRRVR